MPHGNSLGDHWWRAKSFQESTAPTSMSHYSGPEQKAISCQA